ncbi:WXG100 family type VII secretion target [Actinoplanes sp. NPDC049316]|uniref:WXG100 family type VII secretion target n=1 Tax=Actinoplanes sp. NPDC049316 TaxID=3154727 RepID=UPI0034164DA3
MAFADVEDPTGRLTDPAARTESILGAPFANPGSVMDWLSPTHIVNEFVKQLTGYDAFGEAAKVFAGDWEAVWKAAGAFSNLAAALQDIGINMSHGNLELDQAWDGRAAEAAYAYFTDLASAISSQQLVLYKLSEAYQKAAEGTYRQAEVYSGLMKDAYDAALVAALAASAGTATIETGIGAVTGYAIAAYETYKLLETLDKAKKIASTALTLMNEVVGLIQGLSADAGEFTKYPLPGGAYDHPGV